MMSTVVLYAVACATVVFIGIGCMLLAGTIIAEAVTDWRRQKHGGISWN